MAAKKRVLIIGLDGFTWRLGRSLMDEGVMPNLKRLVEGGCHGNLISVMPFETAPAWTSFQTGCSPGKTGIFAFHGFDRQEGTIYMNSFSRNLMPSIWELANRAGRKVVSINMPVSSPSPKVDGVMIPGLLCPKLSAEAVHPPEAYDKYIKPHKNYMIVNNNLPESLEEFVHQSVVVEQERCEVALEIMNDVEWDIFCVQVQSTDFVQHRAWWALDPERTDCSLEAREEVYKLYRVCDDAIGRICEAAGGDVLAMVVSDHGFCGLEGWVGINVWLKQNGYLNLNPPQSPSDWTLMKNSIKEKIPPLKAMAVGYGRIMSKIKSKKSVELPLFCETDYVDMKRMIDFKRTKAVCVGGMGGVLYIINDSPEERAVLANQISQEILRDLGPGSPLPVVRKVSPGVEVYGSCDEASHLPDLVIEYESGYESRRNPGGEVVVGGGLVDDKQRGTHAKEGIFIAYGPQVKCGVQFEGDIIDVVPTVLGYLGIPVPRHLDGKVWQDAFVEFPEIIYEDVAIDGLQAGDYSDVEQAKLEKQLEDLGYI